MTYEHEDLGRLPDDVVGLLRAERAAPGPGAAVEHRVRQRVQATIAGLSALGAAAEAEAATAAAPATGAALGAGKMLAIASALAAATAVVVVVVSSGQSPLGDVANAHGNAPAAAVAESPLPPGEEQAEAEPPAAPVPSPQAEPAPEPTAEPATPAATERRAPAHVAQRMGIRRAPAVATLSTAKAQPPRPTARPARGVDSPEEERRLLMEGQRALVQGKYAAALRAFSRHAKRFPHGLLAEEREAGRVRALARLGRLDEARSHAERFEMRYPNSIHLAPLRQSLREPAMP